MSEQAAPVITSAKEHPLDGYTPTSRTVWNNRADGYCEVRSLQAAPQEINRRESCGRQKVKGTDPEFAAQVYRETRKLPEDWPVEVIVMGREPAADGQPPQPFQEVFTVQLPQPFQEVFTVQLPQVEQVGEATGEPLEGTTVPADGSVHELVSDETPPTAEAALDVDGQTAQEDDPANPDA